MIRTVIYLYVILLVVSSGLLLTGDLKGANSTRVFRVLDSSINTFSNVGATGDTNGLVAGSGLADPNDSPDFFGFINFLKEIAIGIVSVFVFLAVGSVEVIDLIDPSHTWGLLIVAPIALFQLSGFVFLIIEIVNALRGG